MKKVFCLSILGIFMLTGCGAGATKTMKCTYESNANNITSKMTYNIDYEKKEVKKVRITYDYHQNMNENAGTNNNMNNNNVVTGDNDNANINDGVGTGTDGTTNDTQPDNDGIIDGIVGSTIDSIINGVTDTILDISGIRDRHINVQNTYGNMNGFSVQSTDDIAKNSGSNINSEWITFNPFIERFANLYE